MKKRKFLLPLAALMLLTISACNGGGGGSGGDPVDPPGPVDPPVVTKYTVTFNSKGGSAVRKQEVEENQKATRPTDPTKAGYDFVNWYTEVAYTNVYDFNTPVTKDFTLYAKWALSVSPVLLASLTPDSVDSGDTEFSVWTTSDFIGHTKDGWQTGCLFNMSWRTIAAFDSEGRICFATWCPANGYGVPSEYSYICHEYYSEKGVTYLNNPAFKFGETYASNGVDWELVVPEGGFIITGHTNGANMIDEIVTGGKFELYGGTDEELARSFNKAHCEFSTRSAKFVDGKVEVYDLATHMTYTGAQAGAFVGDATTASYTKELVLYEGDTLSFNFFDGVVDFDITENVVRIEGDYTKESNHAGKMYVETDAQGSALYPKVLHAGSRGKYTFTYTYTTNVFNIAYEESLNFYVYLNNVLKDEYSTLGVTFDKPFTLPTPETPSGYTFSRWINGNGQTVESGTYNIKDDMNLFAVFSKDGNEYAYSGKQSIVSTTANTTLTVLDDKSGFIAHTHSGWSVGCTWDMSWRTIVIIDGDGRVCYAVRCPANGYGGPNAYSYHCDPYYQASGVGYENNPAFVIDPEYDDWPNTTTDGRQAWNLFELAIPTGGYLVSCYGAGSNAVAAMLSNGEFTEVSDKNQGEFNKTHSWDNVFEVSGGFLYSRINLD